MRILDLFAGTGSATQPFKDRGHEVVSVELDNQFAADFRNVLELPLESMGRFDFIWASPPCTTFSVASIGHYWNKDLTPKKTEALYGLELVKKTLKIVEYFNPSLGFIIENPRGMLRKMPLMKDLQRSTVTYCAYNDTRMKPTDLWGYAVGWTPRNACKNGDTCHERAPRGSRTGTQGIKGAKDRSRIPYELGLEICKAIEQYTVRPAVL